MHQILPQSRDLELLDVEPFPLSHQRLAEVPLALTSDMLHVCPRITSATVSTTTPTGAVGATGAGAGTAVPGDAIFVCPLSCALML